MPDGRLSLELGEVTNFVDRLMALCFTASSVVHEWKFVYNLSVVGGSYQLH
jgi:hypothetical protein